MKISQELRSQLDSNLKTNMPPSANGKNFEGIIHSQTNKLQQEELQRLMKSLNAQGERLASSCSLQDLAKYKRMVKEFVKEAVQYGMNLKHSHSFNSEGGSRKLIIVEEIDKKLLELTNAMRDQEKRPINLLGIIGEVKGMLINLYT